MDGAAVGARASEDGRPLRGRRSGRPAPAASCSSCATASTTVSGPGRSSIAARGTPSRHPGDRAGPPQRRVHRLRAVHAPARRPRRRRSLVRAVGRLRRRGPGARFAELSASDESVDGDARTSSTPVVCFAVTRALALIELRSSPPRVHVRGSASSASETLEVMPVNHRQATRGASPSTLGAPRPAWTSSAATVRSSTLKRVAPEVLGTLACR
jgi:hypothetical protein